jgi:fatty acid desaturase
LHECSHDSFFASRLTNRLVGNLTAALLATPFEEFRMQHMEHHRLVGTSADPSAVDYWVRFRSRAELLWFLLSPLVGASLFLKLGDYYRGLRGRAPTSPGARATRRYEGLIAVALVQGAVLVVVSRGLILTDLWRYPVFVLLPGATIFLFLSRLRMHLEHGSLNYDRIDYTLRPRLTARTIVASPLERVLLCGANFNYHHEHHLYPRVPAWQLPRFHADVIRAITAPDDLRQTYWQSLVELWRHLGRSESRA